jgi:signal transduction histidine kinase
LSKEESKRRSWPLIAFAFAALLIVVGISAYDVVRQTWWLRDNILKAETQARLREKLLTDVREDSGALAIAIRDFLLEPGQVNATVRPQLNDLHRSLLLALERLQDPRDTRQSDLVLQLRILQEQYWQTAMVPLGWPDQERRTKGILFLRQKLVPLRESAMESARNIELIEASLLGQQRVRFDESFVRLDGALKRTWMLTLLIGLVIAVLTVWRFSKLEQQAASLQRQSELDRERLHHLAQSLVNAHEDERKSLARELHDQIGQMLTAIQMVFANLELRRGDPERQVEDGKSLTERTVSAVRNISMGLRPSILDDFGLGPAIEWQTREFSKRSGVEVELQMDGHLDGLAETQTICLYRVIQEALTNCARHAKATNVRINLQAGTGTISLTIEDNGQGFDPASLPKRGLGLFGMQERVRELGGTVSISARPGKGTLVKIAVPSGTDTSK